MKKGLFILLVLFAVISSCKKDDDAPGYNFIDKALSGKIEGGSWTFRSGYVDSSSYEGVKKLSMSFYGVTGDACSDFLDGDRVIFSVPMKIGVFPLKFSFTDLEGSQTVTLFDDETSMNNIATSGAIEILSISSTSVTGRIDATSDDDNTINGNFTVSFCQPE